MPTTLQLLLALAGSHPPLVAIDSPPPAPPAPQQVRAIRLGGGQAVTIDGLLNEPLWQSAEKLTGFTQRDPTQGAVPTESTVVYVAYDDAALYIGARLYDSHPDSIVARLARRDQGTNSDRFQIYIDPYHDKRSGFYFGINAAGTLYDGTLFNDDWDDDTWDGVWEGKVTRDATGWTAELRIPYSQLRFVRKNEYVWGINFRRDIARKNEFDYIAYTPRDGRGFVSRFPDLVGIERIEPPRRREILPYATSRAAFTHQPAGNPFNDGSKFDPGFGADAKIGLGSNLTLNATVNPDFGQVEVDPAVVNLSDRETFFNEKRPFFVEGSSIFEFGFGGQSNFWGFNWSGPSFFYSRRIGRSLGLPGAPDKGYVDGPDGAHILGYVDGPDGAHILGALKLTGKVAGSWNVGGLTAVTARERATLQDSLGGRWGQEMEPLATYGAYRAQKEFAKGRQGLGFMTTFAGRAFDDPTLRDFRNNNSTTLGADGWVFLDSAKTWVTTAWVGRHTRAYDLRAAQFRALLPAARRAERGCGYERHVAGRHGCTIHAREAARQRFRELCLWRDLPGLRRQRSRLPVADGRHQHASRRRPYLEQTGQAVPLCRDRWRTVPELRLGRQYQLVGRVQLRVRAVP